MSNATERAIHYLAQAPLLKGVSEQALRGMDPPPEMISIKSGEILIRQGEDNTDYFLLVSGRLRVFRETDGQLTPIGNVFPGEGVGEMALLMNEPRYATVIARLDSELVRFPQSTFLSLAGEQPLAILNIARTVIARATGSADRRKTEYPSIAVLPLTPGVDTRPLARGLARHLKKFGTSRCVDGESTEDLDELESRFAFVVYATDATNKEWAKSCMLRADLILLAANTVASPDPGEIEREVFARAERNILGRVDLVMVHPETWLSHCGTEAWLRRLHPKEFHHLRLDNDDDLGRMARIAAGRANNIVLSGGGARAFAQIGTLRALKEFGIPVDRIGGTSMGAAVGAAMAFADNFEEMVRRLRELFLKRRPAKDLTLPLLSLLTGKKLAGIAVDVFGDQQIEDLPIRYFCLSSNLANGEIVEHFDGPLWVALRSTAAIPVVAPPLLRDGVLLVDGGVLNNLPIDVMVGHFSGSIIAVDVSSHQPLVLDARWDLKCPSGFEILRERLSGPGVKVGLPNILEVLLRTATLSSGRHAKKARDHADLLLTPPTEECSVLNFDDFDKIVEIGYDYSRRFLEHMEPGKLDRFSAPHKGNTP